MINERKNKELKKPEVIIAKMKYASMLPLYRKQRFFLKEGPEGIKWELGLAGFCPGKMGFKPLGLGFGHWEWE